jgi:hypothetical protein
MNSGDLRLKGKTWEFARIRYTTEVSPATESGSENPEQNLSTPPIF